MQTFSWFCLAMLKNWSRASNAFVLTSLNKKKSFTDDTQHRYIHRDALDLNFMMPRNEKKLYQHLKCIFDFAVDEVS